MWPFLAGLGTDPCCIVGTTTTDRPGRDLREARTRAGLTRAQLAELTGCSLAQLANIEQGAVPKRSRVLEAARAIFASLDPTTSEAPAVTPGLRENSGRQARPRAA